MGMFSVALLPVALADGHSHDRKIAHEELVMLQDSASSESLRGSSLASAVENTSRP